MIKVEVGGISPSQRECDVDLASFILSLHFWVQFSVLRRWVCRFAVAVMGFVWHERMAVSSA